MFDDKIKKLNITTADEPKLVFETLHTSRRDETRLPPTSKKPPSFVAFSSRAAAGITLTFISSGDMLTSTSAAPRDFSVISHALTTQRLAHWRKNQPQNGSRACPCSSTSNWFSLMAPEFAEAGACTCSMVTLYLYDFWTFLWEWVFWNIIQPNVDVLFVCFSFKMFYF